MTIKKWILISAICMLTGLSVIAQTRVPVQGYCEDGGKKVVTQGLQSTTAVQASYPNCLVTVYIHDTSNLATIYPDEGPTPLPNPFTATASGEWIFYAVGSSAYDVVMSGGSPIALPSPVSLVGLNTAAITNAGISSLTGPVTATGPGAAVTTITPTGVAPGNYTLGSQVVTVNAGGQITGIGNPFTVSIAACSACGAHEIGFTTANPATFTLSYANGTPASASVSDGTNTDNLSSPFTSGSLAAIYCTVAQGATSFSFAVHATATNTQTSNANNSASCAARTFFGVGTGGATGATASGNNAVLVGATGTLGTWGLGTNTGTVSVSPSSQFIYFLLSTSGHTFKVNGFVTTFSCSAITFANQYTASVAMQLCVSPTNATGTYSVEVD